MPPYIKMAAFDLPRDEQLAQHIAARAINGRRGLACDMP
jgi:hypothetical protein